MLCGVLSCTNTNTKLNTVLQLKSGSFSFFTKQTNCRFQVTYLCLALCSEVCRIFTSLTHIVWTLTEMTQKLPGFIHDGKRSRGIWFEWSQVELTQYHEVEKTCKGNCPVTPAIQSSVWRKENVKGKALLWANSHFMFNSQGNTVPRLFSTLVLINSGEIKRGESQMWPRSGGSPIIRIRIIPFSKKLHISADCFCTNPSLVLPYKWKRSSAAGQWTAIWADGWCAQICWTASLLFICFPAVTSLWRLSILWLHQIYIQTHFVSLFLSHVPTPVHPTLHLTFFQTNTCKFSLTENTKLLQALLQLNKRHLESDTSQEERGFPLY